MMKALATGALNRTRKTHPVRTNRGAVQYAQPSSSFSVAVCVRDLSGHVLRAVRFREVLSRNVLPLFTGGRCQGPNDWRNGYSGYEAEECFMAELS